MKDKLRHICGFFAGFLIVLLVVCIPFNSLKELGTQYLEVLKKTGNVAGEKENSLDVIILGDSIAWAGYSPLAMYAKEEISVYNCATSGQNLNDSIAILKRVLKTQKPKVVVLDANSVFTPGAIWKLKLKNVLRINRLTTQIFPVFKYHDYYLKGYGNEKGLDYMKGYNYSANVTSVSDTNYMVEKEVVWSEHDQNMLTSFYKLCNENQISLLLTALPCPHTWNQTKHDLIQKWADTNSVEFIDYNVDSTVDYSKDFRDNGEHLNNTGANKYSDILSDYLVKNYSVSSKKNESYEEAISNMNASLGKGWLE